MTETLHFEFHYSIYKQATAKLADGQLTAGDFKRWDDIRESAATAIALEAGIIEHIPATGRLANHHWQAFQTLINRYEIGEIAA